MSVKKVCNKTFRRKIWGKGGAIFDASCSPKSDKSIVFEGFYPNSGEGNFYDKYVEGLVAKELEEKLMPEIKRISADCLIKPLVSCNNNFTNKNDVTLEKFVSQVENARCYNVIIINKDELKDISIEEEYNIFSEKLSKINVIDGSIALYFVDGNTLDKCKEYFKTSAGIYSEFDGIVKSYKDMGFGYPYGKISITFEQYSKLRHEVK